MVLKINEFYVLSINFLLKLLLWWGRQKMYVDEIGSSLVSLSPRDLSKHVHSRLHLSKVSRPELTQIGRSYPLKGWKLFGYGFQMFWITIHYHIKWTAVQCANHIFTFVAEQDKFDFQRREKFFQVTQITKEIEPTNKVKEIFWTESII